MNCKPGDVAVVVANDITVAGGFCGVHVRVTVLRVNENREPAWEYEGKRLVDMVSLRLARMLGLPAHEATVQVLPDAILRPIRGGDVTDDEVRDLYAPQQPETVHAQTDLHAEINLRAFVRMRGFAQGA